jgi:hypothetical protein
MVFLAMGTLLTRLNYSVAISSEDPYGTLELASILTPGFQ